LSFFFLLTITKKIAFNEIPTKINQLLCIIKSLFFKISNKRAPTHL